MSLITVLFLWGLISDKESYNGKEHSRVNKNEKKVREKKNKSKIEDSSSKYLISIKQFLL